MQRYWRRHRQLPSIRRERVDLERLHSATRPVTLSVTQLRAFCELFEASQNLVAGIVDMSESDEYKKLLEAAHEAGHSYIGEDITEETQQVIDALLTVQKAFNITNQADKDTEDR